MTSLEQAYEWFVALWGGNAIWYGGTGTSGSITGNPTGGSGTGSSYPPGGTFGSDSTSGGTSETNGIYIDYNVVGDSTSLTPVMRADEIVLELTSPQVLQADEMIFNLGPTPGHLTLEIGDPVVVPDLDIEIGDGRVINGNMLLRSVTGSEIRRMDIFVGTANNDQMVGSGLVIGGAGDDFLVGSSMADVLIGGDGSDTLVGGAGADVFDGRAGFDLVSYHLASSGIVASLNAGGMTGDALGDTFDGIEGLAGSAFNDKLSGAAGDDLLIGNAGDDTLIGGGGNDYLVGGIGNNVLEGGAGADTLDGSGGWGVADYSHAGTAVTINLDGAANSGSQAAGDKFININGVFGSSFGDTLNGNANANWMIGGLGNDTVSGGLGSDTLYGSEGDDSLVGGDGNDRLNGDSGSNILEGGAGADTLDGSSGWGVAYYHNAHTAVTVRLDNTGNSGDQAAGDVFININGAWGSLYGDTLVGNGNANWIIGDSGNDTVLGGAGNDTLYGSDGDDSLDGGTGDDLLIGGPGKNVLTGGSGRDVFAFDAALSIATSSRITDFNLADDKIQLSRGVFAGFGSNVSLAFGSMANSGSAQIIYNSSTGDLSYDADGLGGGLAVKFASVAAGLALNAGHFLLV